MELTRKEILKGDFRWPNDIVKLIFTNHFKERLNHRSNILDCFPNYVRVTKDNIYSGRTFNGTDLISVVVKLNYSSTKDLYLCFNPFDGGCKTFWFRSKNKQNGTTKRYRRDFKQAV